MWEISLSGQVSAFLFSLLLGAVLAVVYDIIRATRDAGLNSFTAVFIGDILFWLISAFTVFIYLMGVTNGEVRAYVLLSATAGFLFYRLTIGKAVYFSISRLFALFAFLLKRFSFCLLKTVLLCGKPLKYILRHILPVAGYPFAALKKLLKSIYSMLYTVRDKKKLRYHSDEQRK